MAGRTYCRRPRALLSALVAAGDRGAGAAELVDTVWEAELPANPRKALQVLVSRLRRTTTARIIERTATGYRLGLDRCEVDVLARDDLAHEATALYAEDRITEAAQAAQFSLAIGASADA